MLFTPSSRRRGGAFFKLLVFLVIFLGVLTAAWIFFLPLLLTSTLTKRTGFDVQVKSLSFNPFAADVVLEGLVINNPKTFPRKDYLDIRSFRVRAPIKTLFGENAELDYLEIDIEHITFVRNTDGTLNTTLFYDRLFPKPKPAKEEEPATPTKGAKSPNGKPQAKQPPLPPKPEPEAPAPRKKDFLIRRLELKIDKVTTEDHLGKNPVIKDFGLGIDQLYLNVTDPRQLFRPAVIRALSPVATAITGLIPGSLGTVLNSAVDTPATGGKDSKKKAPDVLKSISDTLEESRKP